MIISPYKSHRCTPMTYAFKSELLFAPCLFLRDFEADISMEDESVGSEIDEAIDEEEDEHE